MLPRLGSIASLLVPAGCCLSVVSGHGTTGGQCVRGPASNLQSYAVYTTPPLFGLVSADLNGDGLLDLVATQLVVPQAAGFQVFFGLPDGGLAAPVPYEGAQGHALAVGDVDGDGWPDVVVSNLDAPGIKIFLNDRAGGLQLQAGLATAGVVHGIAIGDLNNDGLADLALSEVGDASASLELAFGKGAGAFSSPLPLPNLGGTLWGGLVVADLNGDGLPDIATNTSDGGQLAVLLSQGDGGFQTTLYSPAVLGQLALLPNASGAPDLLLGNANPKAFLDGGPTASGIIQVLRNSGRGTFSLGASYDAPGGLTLAVGDFNGDCIPDIATSNFGAPPATWGISVLYGNGDGGFEPAVSLQATTQTPGFLAPMGPVESPRALAVGSTGLTLYGDASKR